MMMSPTRFGQTVLILIAVTAYLAAPRPAPAADRPNVLFIISDDLTAEALSCYGNKQCNTPNIDRLAARGVRFARAYCQYPVCGPSRAALMSGMYPQAIGVMGNGSAGRFTQVLGDRPSMAGLFKRNAYFTARVSKVYHMRIPGDITHGVHGPDHAASWTQRYSFRSPEWMSKGEHEHLSSERLRFAKDVHYGLGFGGAFYVVKTSTDGSEQNDVMGANKAIELLEKHADKPFFLAVGFIRPHVPLVAPRKYWDPYPQQKMTLAKQADDDWADIPKPGITGSSQKRGLDTATKKRKVLAAYYAAVSFMDEQVGRVLAALDKTGKRDNTIVVFTSDHGYHLGEHEFWQKMSLHEESTRIPLIVAAPGVKPGESSSLVQQIDIYPTLAELAGFDVPAHVQGRSLAPTLRDTSHVVHDAVYCVRRRSDHLIRTQRWAYIAYGDGQQEELYDMAADPHQFTNLAGDVKHKATLDAMRKRLKAKLKQIGPAR